MSILRLYKISLISSNLLTILSLKRQLTYRLHMGNDVDVSQYGDFVEVVRCA